MSAHTPGPWKVEGSAVWSDGPNSRMICDFKKVSRYPNQYVANAEYIVRACNSHEAMLEALKGLRNEAAALCQWRREQGNPDEETEFQIDKADEAIRLAEGRG